MLLTLLQAAADGMGVCTYVHTQDVYRANLPQFNLPHRLGSAHTGVNVRLCTMVTTMYVELQTTVVINYCGLCNHDIWVTAICQCADTPHQWAALIA